MSRNSLLKEAVLKAGEVVNSFSRDNLDVKVKEGKANFVTAADFASEKSLIETITKSFHNDTILSEETKSDLVDLKSVDHLWIMDPIDGTNNFLYDRKFSCISVGYAEKGILLLGAIYDFNHDILFFAEKGKGAFENNKQIFVSKQSDLSNAIVATDYSLVAEETRRHLQILANITPAVPLIKGSAALDLCEVASARSDIYYHSSLNSWDCAAGIIIVKEAGGIVTNFKGEKVTFDSPEIVAGNKTIVKEFIAKISEHHQK